MALATITVRQGLQAAIDRCTRLNSNVLLSAIEQGLANNLGNVCRTALGLLRADNTITPGQRAAQAAAIHNAIKPLDSVETIKGQAIGVTNFYDAMDVASDSADAIAAGLGSFISNVAVGP